MRKRPPALEAAIHPRTAELHPAVSRAWGLNPGAVVLSDSPPQPEVGPQEVPRITILKPDRLQDALDRAWKRYGDGTTVLAFPEAL